MNSIIECPNCLEHCYYYYNRDLVLELIYSLWTRIQDNQKETPIIESEDKELIMSLRSLFRERLAQEKQEGLTKGLIKG